MRRWGAIVAGLAVVALVAGCGSDRGGSDDGPTSGGDTSGSVTAPRLPEGVALPPANAQFDYQLGGAYEPPAGVTLVARDRTASPAPGVFTICYVNGFQSQPDEKSFWFDDHPDLILRRDGKPVSDPGYPDEFLFDLTTAAKRSAVADIVGGWIDGCEADGFRAVEADNLDAYTRSRGGYGVDQALAFAALLTARAHRAGLPIGQKNSADLGTRGRDVGFDFAVAEECQVYEECGDYTDVYGDEVFEIEYTDNGEEAFPAACADHGERISVILRDRDLVPRGDPGYVYRAC
ncbi:endo alpha-1,4 polygalactosaminidase [Jatrophihabitans sp. YIM 134969]